MRDIKNKLTAGKSTKNIQRRKGKMFGYQVLGFGSGGPGFTGMVATGGNSVTTVGNFKVHTFTSPGTFQVTCASSDPAENAAQYLIVGGGGGMGYGYGGAGGAGGYRAAGCGPSPLQASNAPTPVASYPIVVGAGGAGGPVMPVGPYSPASKGNDSSAISLTATGGGLGASVPGGSSGTGGPGGSGGGAGGGGAQSGSVSGGTGNQPPVSPPQGNNGESGPAPEGHQGGGAGAAGSSPRTSVTGVTNSIDGTPRKYACGGRSGQGTPNAISPRANSGFGGTSQGVAGCSGIVIIKYRIA